jgi:tRNA nucleotidyltransferase (CCA-adding enzyme)
MATGDPPIVVQMDDPGHWRRGQAVCEAVRAAGGRALLVGGCVRDCALGLPAADLDIEVYGIPAARLLELLSERFSVDLVGRAFPVFKIRGVPIDVSIPDARRGDRAAEALADPMRRRRRLGRRDFTINAIAVDALSGEVIDPFAARGPSEPGSCATPPEIRGGPAARPYRGMQLAARFDLDVAAETVALAGRPARPAPSRADLRRVEGSSCPEPRPSRGLAFLRDCGWTRHFPELAALIGCPQDPGRHPEGDVRRTRFTAWTAFAAERSGDERRSRWAGGALPRLRKALHDGEGGGWPHHREASRARGRGAGAKLPRPDDRRGAT